MSAILPWKSRRRHNARMHEVPPRRPGDQIIDRYAPQLTPEERELAHEQLRALARLLIRIHERLGIDIPGSDSTDLGAQDTIPPTPPPPP